MANSSTVSSRAATTRKMIWADFAKARDSSVTDDRVRSRRSLVAACSSGARAPPVVEAPGPGCRVPLHGCAGARWRRDPQDLAKPLAEALLREALRAVAQLVRVPVGCGQLPHARRDRGRRAPDPTPARRRWPGRTMSRAPPRSAATTGAPAAMASTIVIPKSSSPTWMKPETPRVQLAPAARAEATPAAPRSAAGRRAARPRAAPRRPSSAAGRAARGRRRPPRAGACRARAGGPTEGAAGRAPGRRGKSPVATGGATTWASRP